MNKRNVLSFWIKGLGKVIDIETSAVPAPGTTVYFRDKVYVVDYLDHRIEAPDTNDAYYRCNVYLKEPE